MFQCVVDQHELKIAHILVTPLLIIILGPKIES